MHFEHLLYCIFIQHRYSEFSGFIYNKSLMITLFNYLLIIHTYNLTNNFYEIIFSFRHFKNDNIL